MPQETLTFVSSRIDVNNEQYADAEEISVTSSTGEANSSRKFSATFNNHNGRRSSSFTVGNAIQIFADDTVNVHSYVFPYEFNFVLLNRIFNGTIEEVKFSGKGVDEKVTISGRDYTARLQDATVLPAVYNNTEVSAIVTDIISDNITGVTTNNVTVTATTLSHIAFNHTPVFDALKQLADLSGYFFYVDTDNDLHFELKGLTSSGITFNNTNVISSVFKTSDREIVNRIWVYGGRQLTGAQNVFTANGGSVFTLDWKPHNTEVFVNNGSTPYVGGIFEVTVSLGSPLQYLVDYDLRQIIFVSGTVPGFHIPGSASGVQIDYQRSVPIVKFGQEATSIDTYGVHGKVIVDKNIVEPSIAEDLVRDELDRNSTPFRQGTLKLHNLLHITAGNTAIVNLPYQGVSSQTYDILEVDYNFTADENRYELNTTVKVSKKISDVTDTIKQMILDIKKLQAEDAETSDVITRLEYSAGSFGLRCSEWRLITRNIGASFILGHDVNGILGSPAPSVSGPNVVLGDYYAAGSSIILSGGTWT